MNKKKQDEYKEKLFEMKEKITSVFENIAKEHLNESIRESSGDLSGYSMHMADAGTDNWDREFALSIAGRENEILHKIDYALNKIDEKTFGMCEMCEVEIASNRLDAIPYAENCIKCESEIEKEQT